MQMISESERSVQELAKAHGWWNTWSVRLVAATVIVTALYFLAQWMTNRRGNELSSAQAALIRAKDAQLAGELKAKDVLIAEADKKAEEANKQAGVANAAASKADERAGTANARAEEIAQENIKLKGEFDKSTEEARVRAEELKKQNLETEARLGKESQTRLEMEESLAPRILEQLQSSENLKRFAGMRVILECVNDLEAQRMAGQLAVVFRMAGWNLDGPWIEDDDENPLAEKIDIEANVGPDTEAVWIVSSALAEQLKANKIESSQHPAYPELPPNTLRVKVGLRPLSYFSQKKLQELFPGKTGNGDIMFGNMLRPMKRPKKTG